MTALLPQIILLPVRATCELRLACVRIYTHNSKTNAHIGMLYLMNNSSTIRYIYFLG